MRRELNEAEEWFELWSARATELAGTPVTDLAIAQGFAVTTRQVLECGMGHADIRREVRRGTWSRPARGVLSPVVVTASGSDGDRQRHAMQATAAARVRPDHVITGGSACVLHALPVLHLPEEAVLTSRDDDTRGLHRGAHIRTAALPATAITNWFGAPVATAARTVVDQPD